MNCRDLAECHGKGNQRRWKSCRRKVKTSDCIQSTAGHVKPGGNTGGPSSKPKYYSVTDREEVLWRKGEKHPGRGVKENLKPCVYKHRKFINERSGTFCRMVRRVNVTGKVKVWSRSESESEKGAWSQLYSTRNRVTYPCPGWSAGKTSWRAEPTPVEMVADEVWVAEKFQSNPEIAGSLRNSFRASLGIDYWR